MTRAQFLNDLYRRLGALSREQAEQHLTYYAEMLADRMEEGMSEEEAVNSMEDLDTIAQRILQDEGITGMHPPRAPDLPEQPAGKKSAAKPPRDWRKYASIALWAAAVAVVVSVAVNHLNDRRGRETTAVDYGSDFTMGPDGIQYSDGETEVYIGPGGIRVNGEDAAEWTESFEELEELEDLEEVMEDMGYWDNGSYSFPGESCVFSAQASGLKKLEVEWIAGNVSVQPSDDGGIHFQEYATRELTDKTKMVYKVEDDTLTIRYWEGKHKNEHCAKRLLLQLPAELLEKLSVDTTSADVWMEDLAGLNKLHVDTTSGNVNLSVVEAREVEIDTTSGDVYLTDVSAGELNVDTASGDVSGNVEAQEVEVDTASGNVFLDAGDGRDFDLDTVSGTLQLSVAGASSISADSTSGHITLLLPGDSMGFSLEFETVSGALDTGGYSVTRNGGRYVHGDGSCKIEVDTVSGGLSLQ